jgi:hypothetical protein
MSRTLAGTAALGATVLLVIGCTGPGATPTNGPSTGPTATPTQSPTAGPTGIPSAQADFGVDVYPAQDPPEARVAIPGEKVSFLVVITSPGSDAPFSVTAAATGARVTDIRPAQLKPGAVGEVWVIPDVTTVDAVATVKITAERGASAKVVDRTIMIMPMVDDRAKDAKPYFDLWTAYLAKNHPELGITAGTKWDATYVSTFLVVSHYAYYSEEWEMKIAWHNMIPPYDWTEVYLRHRGTEWKPSLDFKIDSVSGKTAPHVGELPDAIMR